MDRNDTHVETDKILPVDLIHSILHVYNSCAHVSATDRKHPMASTAQTDDVK